MPAESMTDYDEPGGRAWDGWPALLAYAGLLLAVGVVGLCVGVVALVTGTDFHGGPQPRWRAVVLVSGSALMIGSFAWLVREEARARRRLEAELIREADE